MKTTIVSIISFGASVALAASTQGFDISSYQPDVDFAGAYASGARFVIIKVSCHCFNLSSKNLY